MRFEIIPHKGIGQVRLGMRRADVRAAVGSAPVEYRKARASAHTTDAFHEVLHVVYAGADPQVEYVELSNGAGLVANLFGLDVFTTPAADLVAQLDRLSPFDRVAAERGYSYVFPTWDLALWRPVVPETDSDPEGRYFATIGVGIPGYFPAGRRQR